MRKWDRFAALKGMYILIAHEIRLGLGSLIDRSKPVVQCRIVKSYLQRELPSVMKESVCQGESRR